MNTLKSILTAAVVSIIIGVGVIVYQHPSPVQAPAQEIVKGAPDLSNSPYLIVNNVTTWYASEAMRTATTSLCSFAAPLGTSTLERVSFSIQAATGTAAAISVASSTNNYATSSANLAGTYILDYSVPAGALAADQFQASGDQKNYMLYSSTTTPEYVNVLTDAAGLGGYTYGGDCTATFDQLF